MAARAEAGPGGVCPGRRYLAAARAEPAPASLRLGGCLAGGTLAVTEAVAQASLTGGSRVEPQ